MHPPTPGERPRRRATGTPDATAAHVPFARAVSIVLHPFVVAPLLALAAEPRAARVRPTMVALAVLLVLVLPLALLTWRQVRRGAWTTVDASRPADRPVLFAVTAGALAALWLALGALAPGSATRGNVGGLLGLVALCAVVTRWVKLSLHLLVATLAVTVLHGRFPLASGALAGALPLLGWSRVALGRHRWREVIAGAALGVVAGVLLRAR